MVILQKMNLLTLTMVMDLVQIQMLEPIQVQM